MTKYIPIMITKTLDPFPPNETDRPWEADHGSDGKTGFIEGHGGG